MLYTKVNLKSSICLRQDVYYLIHAKNMIPFNKVKFLMPFEIETFNYTSKT
jgi:hypothetical protein